MSEKLGRLSGEKDSRLKLDLKDRKILSLLSEDSRMPLTQIAKKVQLSRDSVNYRINRMKRKGVILRFFPIIELKQFGYQNYLVYMLLDEKDKEDQKRFISALKSHPNVRAIMEYSDRWDIGLVIVAKGLLDFDNVITDIMNISNDLVIEKEKLAVIKEYHNIHLPQKFYWDIKHEFKHRGSLKEKVKMDETDFKIMRILSKDARLSTVIIGERLGISPDAVSYRIKNLLKNNVIKRFSVLVDLSKLNYNWYTYCISTKVFDEKADIKIKGFIRKHPYILKAVKTVGNWDLVLQIVTESQKMFHSIVKEIKNEFASIIKTYETNIAYKEHLYEPFPEVIKFDSKE